MQYVDQPRTGRHAILSPEFAVISGQIKTDGLDDLRRFERAFPLDPRDVIAVAKEVLENRDLDLQPDGTVTPEDARREFSPKEKSDIVFKDLLPRVYRPGAVPGWTSTMYFSIDGAGDYTVEIKPDGILVGDGKVGTPDTSVAMNADTFTAVMRFEVLDDADLIDDVNIVDDEDMSEALSDEQLELVAGGKGACGGEACGGDACGGDACGAAAGGGGACGAATCGAAACAGDACGAAACGSEASVGTACGGAACGAAAGATGGCGGDACGAAAGTGSCGAAACGAAACAGDYCAAAACPAAACAGAVCGADVAPGPDIGPCAINVIPVIPFI